MEGGHSCRIATHGEYKNWIEGHEIEFGHVGGDPGEPIELCVENGMFTVSFIREGLKKFRGWLDDNMKTPWKACQNTDVIIESPSAMAGIHVAEKLEIPYFRAFPFPWNRTRAFPHPFAVAERNLGRGYNYITYATIEQVFWKGVSGQINKWRHRSLGLPAATLERMEAHRVADPLLLEPMCRPRSYGLAFLGSHGLEEFLEADPDNKPVYIGFGSMAVSDPNEITRTIIEAVLKSNARAIISKGWSDKSGSKDGSKTTNYPAAIYMLESVPHDWLFHRLAGVVHHGGAGATAAGLRAGVLTMIKLYFGDQRFWAQREEDDGVSVWCRDLTVKKLSSSLSTITTDEKMIKKAQMMGERIRAEDGVGTAIQYFYHDRALAKGRLGDQQKKKRKGVKVQWDLDKPKATGAMDRDWAPERKSSPTVTTTMEHSATFGGKNNHTRMDDAISHCSDRLQTSATEPIPDHFEEKTKERNDNLSPVELAADLEAMHPPHPGQPTHVTHLGYSSSHGGPDEDGDDEDTCYRDISKDDYEDMGETKKNPSKVRKAMKSLKAKAKHVKGRLRSSSPGNTGVETREA